MKISDNGHPLIYEGGIGGMPEIGLWWKQQ